MLALVKVATDGESEAARVSAAIAILDRGYGKPRQSLEHAGVEGGAIHLEVVNYAIDTGVPRWPEEDKANRACADPSSAERAAGR